MSTSCHVVGANELMEDKEEGEELIPVLEYRQQQTDITFQEEEEEEEEPEEEAEPAPTVATARKQRGKKKPPTHLPAPPEFEPLI